MQIRLRKKEKEYAQVHKNLLFDKTLSIQAKGIAAIIEYYSDEFTLTNKSLELNSCLSANTLRKYLKELEIKLFLYRIQIPSKNFESVWFFDSERLDLNFIYEELQKLRKAHSIVIVSDYQIYAGGKIATEELNTYNNTCKQEYTLHDARAGLNYLSKVEKSKNLKKFGTGYTQAPRTKTKVTAHDTT